MSSAYRMYNFIKDLSTKSLAIIFSNPVMIIFTRTGPKGDPIDTLNGLQSSKISISEKCHQNKYDNLLTEKSLLDGV